jgi:hypothetical protein
LLSTLFQLRNELTESVLEERVQSLLRTATIQGQVKAEYVASEFMSRV